MKKDVKAKIMEETYMGTIPILKSERQYSFPDITLAAAGFGIASWCYVQGAWLASTVNFLQALIVAVVPMIFFGLIFMFLVIIPARYGVDYWMYQRSTFGHTFVFIICMLSVIVTIGWYAVNSGVFAGAIINLGKIAGVDLSAGEQAFAIACIVIGWLIALRGPYVVKIATYIMVPCLIGVGILLIVKISSMTSISELMSYEPSGAGTYPNAKVAFLCMVEAMFAFVFSWQPVLGGLSRITKTERSAYWGQFLGFALAMCFFVSIGVISGTLMWGRFGIYSTDPTDWLMALCGPVWSVISIIAIAFANITTQMMGCYCLSIALKVFKPNWPYWMVSLGLSIICTILVLWEGIWTYYNVYLAAVAIIAAPACGIVFADFFFVRKGKFSLKSCFRREGHNEYKYHGGFNLIALLCFVAGVVLYLLTYNPLAYVVRNEILMLLTPTGISWAFSTLLYILLNKIPAVHKYCVPEKEGTFEGPILD